MLRGLQFYIISHGKTTKSIYEFNIREAKKRQERIGEQGGQTGETKEEAKERLLFDRVTMQKYQGCKPDIIYEGEVPESELPKIEPESVSPGVVPKRPGGKKPKCFFALLKSSPGAALMGFAPEPENVYLLLHSNPGFVRVCGFAPKNEKDEYCFKHVPSLRKLEQFDQIMTEWGIWQSIKLQEVRGNIESGPIKQASLAFHARGFHSMQFQYLMHRPLMEKLFILM